MTPLELIENIQKLAQEDWDKNSNRDVAHLLNKFSLAHYLRMSQEINVYLSRYCDSKHCRVLDWGCGNGHMTFFLSRLGCNVIPADVHTLSIKTYFASRLKLNHFINIDSVKLPFKDNSFDAVLSCGVLEHVKDERKSLDELHRIIKPRGFFFIYMLPHKYGLYEFLNTLMGKKRPSS